MALQIVFVKKVNFFAVCGKENLQNDVLILSYFPGVG